MKRPIETQLLINNFMEDGLFPIKITDSEESSIMFVDFDYEKFEKNKNTDIVPGIDVFTKKIPLSEHKIKYDAQENIPNKIFNYLWDLFVYKTHELGDKHRESESRMWLDKEDGTKFFKFDFQVDKETEWHINLRKFVAKMMNMSNYIATDGRVGPGQFIIADETICSMLNEVTGGFSFIGNDNDERNTKLRDIYGNRFVGFLAGIKVFLEPQLNKTAIMGRANTPEQPGLLLVMYNDSEIDDEEKEITIKMDFIDIGFYPEKQYFYNRVLSE